MSLLRCCGFSFDTDIHDCCPFCGGSNGNDAVKHGLGFEDLIVKFKLSPDEAKRYVFGRFA